MNIIIKIKDRNKIIRFRGRKVRTPCEFIIVRTELSLLKTSLRMAGVQSYEISQDIEEVKKKVAGFRITSNDTIKIEDPDEKRTEDEIEGDITILDRLLYINGESE